MPQSPLMVDGINQIAPLQSAPLPLAGTSLVEVQASGKRYKTTIADLLGSGGGVGSIELAPLTHATLPATPTAGTIAYITDSTVATWGTTAVGGGSDKVLVWYNGTNWTIFAT
jgi:hypothetical protein